ncbi:hypothetical protein MIT9_P1036 [Methylomarinovum caldicuralii]|uniref:Metal-dependent hydrolase n=1 Tax=Methylomarinovum caldicuralii TaxID=438856 RepID=A0AAU9CND0_9GAMM|nr:metal-dependent hydrolase [Methylomarinovum caldicuralii]BCX81458.1 hypothetical protein MIT9_P1036 [Methylomarinovum caldicuralii]
MANFKTHLSLATVIAGAAATTVTSTGLAPVSQAPALFALGVLGGLLPDIDADNSTPVRLVFTLLGLAAAFAAVFYTLGHYRFSISELCVLAAAVFAAVRYLIFELFLRLTEHRGVFHSLLAVVFFTLLTTSLSYHFTTASPHLAWLQGLFVGMGYCVHLTLDELFSVDLRGGRLKRSFGTALKPFGRDLKATLAMGVLTVALANTLPNPQVLTNLLSRETLIEPIQEKLWPAQGRWFAQWRHQPPRTGRLLVLE